jgi:hypothetical protein
MLKKMSGIYQTILIITLLLFIGISIGYAYLNRPKATEEPAPPVNNPQAWGDIQGAPVLLDNAKGQPPVYVYEIIDKKTGKTVFVSVGRSNSPVSITAK